MRADPGSARTQVGSAALVQSRFPVKLCGGPRIETRRVLHFVEDGSGRGGPHERLRDLVAVLREGPAPAAGMDVMRADDVGVDGQRTGDHRHRYGRGSLAAALVEGPKQVPHDDPETKQLGVPDSVGRAPDTALENRDACVDQTPGDHRCSMQRTMSSIPSVHHPATGWRTGEEGSPETTQ